MIKPPVPRNEDERLSRLTSYAFVETEKDERLDELTKLAAATFDMPMSIITILDKNRQWFKSRYGVELTESARDISFCQYTIMSNQIFEVTDSFLDKRFRHNPLVTGGPHIRYYCGVPLISREGFALGSFAILDHKPRHLDNRQRKALQLLADLVAEHFELNRDKKDLESTVEKSTVEIQHRESELVQKDKKLNAVYEELTQFMYKASHDLRGPLKTMCGLLQVALADVKDAQAKEYLLLLQKTQQKLDIALDHLLTVVEVKEHTPVWKREPLQQLIQQCINQVADMVPDKKFSYTFQQEGVTEVAIDSFLLKTAIEQILLNCLEHNPSATPEVAIRIIGQEESVQILITDNGPGIKEEVQEHIFKMFFKTSVAGSGLGLYIAKCAVELLSGKISLLSSSKIQTTFAIGLPRGAGVQKTAG